MQAQATILLVVCVGLAAAIPFYEVPSVEEAAQTLYDGKVPKPVEQVAKELAILKEAAHQEQNHEYDAVLEKYLSMQEVSKDKCSHEALLKISRPSEDVAPWEETPMKAYRLHYAAEQFKLCKDQFEPKLAQAVNSMSAEAKKQLELIKAATIRYTNGQTPQQKAAGPQISHHDIGNSLIFYMQKVDAQKFESDVKSAKTAEQLAEEAFNAFTKAVDTVNQSVGSAPFVYFEVAAIPEAVSAFNNFELENIASLRIPSDLADSLHYESSADRIKRTATGFFEEYKKNI